MRCKKLKYWVHKLRLCTAIIITINQNQLINLMMQLNKLKKNQNKVTTEEEVNARPTKRQRKIDNEKDENDKGTCIYVH